MLIKYLTFDGSWLVAVGRSRLLQRVKFDVNLRSEARVNSLLDDFVVIRKQSDWRWRFIGRDDGQIQLKIADSLVLVVTADFLQHSPLLHERMICKTLDEKGATKGVRAHSSDSKRMPS